MKNKTKRIVGCSFIVISIISAIIIFSSKIETRTIKDLSALWDSNRVGSYTLDSGNVIPIPNGFYYVGGDIETGVIISDNAEDAYDSTGTVDKTTHEYAYNLKGNQFVWISCDLVDFIKCDKWNGIKQNATSLANVAWDDSLSMDELLQVAKYGGYYVARYEAGLDETFQEYTSVQYNSGSNQCFNKEGTPQSKINQIPWNLIDWETAKTSAEKMYDTDDVKSVLITGAQWDTMLNQMVKSGVLTDEDLTSSSEIGNYIDTSERDYKGRLSRFYYSSGYWYAPLFTEERTEKTVNYNASTYGEMLTTGICEQNQFYNIFDIAGNAWEWTDELTATDCGVARGGSCVNGSNESPVCYRYGSSKITDTGINIGYRVTLKLPTEEKDKKLLEYTVEYNKGNSGNGSMSSDVFYYGIKTPIKKNTFTHSKGIAFCGWAFEPDGTVKYVDEQIVTRLAMPGEKITLYAVFYDVVNKPDTSAFNQDTTFYVWWDENGNEQNYIPVWMDPPSDWYSYADRKWANIVTRNDGEETYFVWIPRYEYSLDEETQRVNVNLLAKKTAINHEGYTIPEAFWWDKNGDGEETEDEELEGYWITKYQLSESTNSVRINAPMASIGGDTIYIGDITGSLITEAQTNGSTLKYYYYLDGKLIDTGTSSTQHFVYENLKYNKDYTVNIVARNSSDEFVGAVTKTISTNPANPPDLDDYDPETTFYVVYDDEGNETRVPITEPEPENWYNYTIQKKAYIVSTKDEVDRYYVWVPRYEYSLSEEINTTNTAYILGTDKERDIVYIRGTSSLTDDNYVIPAEFDTQPLGYWLTVSDANKPDTSQFNQQHTFYVWWDENGNEQNYIPVAQDPPSQWYDYKKGKWANIVTRNDGEETYYVWIPRYEYQLNEAEQRVDVQFIPGKLTEADNLYTIPEAFWWDANGDGEETPDEELEGYWITKYQLSDSTNDKRITAPMSSIGGDTIRIGDIVGSLITEAESAGVTIKYEYYLDGKYIGHNYSSTGHFVYEGLSNYTDYTINIIARNADTKAYIGAITRTISTNPANAPEIDEFDKDTTYYVTYDIKGNETRTSFNSPKPLNWYNYAMQKKAYIVSTKDGVDRYYVWVPRYEYSLSEEVQTTNTDYIFGTKKERDIIYIRGTSVLTDTNYRIPDVFTDHPTGYWATISQPNAPDIDGFNKSCTYYVVYDDAGNETRVPLTSSAPSNWYDYDKQKWANIVTTANSTETYYVWIPRYQYKLNTEEQRVDVIFLPGTINEPDDGYTIPEAFWWDANGDGEETPDEELTGYWITKYQLGE